MTISVKILILLVFTFTKLNAQDLIKDEDYYNTGVNHYEKGDFKESFIVFFNLSEKAIKTLFIIYQICILKESEQHKVLTNH